MEIFHLTIGEEGSSSGSYAVRVQSAVGDSACTFVPPLGEAELARLADGHYAGLTGRAALEQAGADLFNSVFVDEVRALYQQAIVGAKRDGAFRIVLTLEPDELHLYPWELMHDGERFLAATGHAQLVRRIGLSAPATREVSPPLRVLVAVSDAIDVSPDLDIRAEVARIASALDAGDAYLEIQPAMRHVLQARLREEAFDVVHFCGHGGFVDGEGCLCFETEDSRADLLPATAFGVLVEGRSVPVVVLSACESGVSSKQDVFTGVAHALVRSGIPAVVAMRSSLSDVGATDLVRDFYGALRLDFDVVTAITEARRALYVDRLDWHVPVVYTLHADRETLEKAPGVREAPSKPAFQLSLGLRPSVTVQLEFPAPVLFTKRPEQVRLGAALLASSPQVVSVDGPPGSGKTAIAGDMACRAAQQYHGGVLGLDCRTTNTLDAILVRINEVLLEAWEAQVDLTQPWGRKALSSALGQRPFLIVLDNFESVLDQGGKELESIVGFLRDLPAPSKALVTSRDRLDLGQRVEVCTLEMWPFALLLARAGKRRGITGFDQDLCDRVGLVLADSSRANEMLTSEERRIFNEAHTKLGGLPFAAEIFMGLVAEGESIVELLMDLRPVHERMTDLLDLSFDRLSEGAREMLVLMSVFYKPVKRGAVRAVYNRDDWEILLEELVRSSLVTGNRYGLHPLVREYAESKGSDKSRLSKAHMRAAKYFLTADDADSLAAIDHFYIAEAWGDVVRTANTFAEQLFRSGLWRQASLRMEKAVHAARITGDWGGEIAALNHLGIFHRNLGEAEEAKEYFHQALERATSVGDRTAIGSTLRNLGNAHGILGELPEAAKCHTEGLRIARETGDRRAEGISLGNLGNVYGEMGQAARAMRCYEQALEISREGGDRSAEANDLSNLGTAHAELGEYEMAMDYFEQALEMAVETQDRRTESYALGNIGNAYVALGDAERAIQCHETARTISREIGDRHGETKSVINLGVAYRHLGNIQKAIEYYGQALEIAKQTAYRAGEGKALGNLGSAYAALGQVDKAIHCTGQALEIAREIGGRRSEGTHLDNLGQVCKEEGNHDRALACYLLAIEIGEATGDPRTAARQEKIAQLKEQSGEEEFARLMERVEPNKERIVEEMLQSIAQDRQEDAGA